MVLKERKDHFKDCYFWKINLTGINQKNKYYVQYPHVPSAIKLIPDSQILLAPEPDDNIEYNSDSEDSDMTVVPEGVAYKAQEDDQPVSLRLAELNDLTRNLNLSKESAKLLGSHLKEKPLLAPRTTGMETTRENLDSFSPSIISHHWFIATTLLDWPNQWA